MVKNNTISFKQGLLIIFCIFLLLGCTIHSVPKSDEVYFSKLPRTDKQLSVNIINDQNDSKEITFGRYGFGFLDGDLRSWTNSAVESVRISLGKQGVSVSDKSSRLLKLAVINARIDEWGVPFVAALVRCKIELKADTGDGYSHTYEATNKSASPEWACDKAMYSVVGFLLEDTSIHDYLLGKASMETSRFIDNGNGTVTDRKTGLMWATKDNGSDIEWAEAKKYCENYRGGGFTGWRMPTQDELEWLYDSRKSYKAIQKGYDLHLTEKIQLSTCCPWASEISGSSAAYFDFAGAYKNWYRQSSDGSMRALPVRSGK